MKFVVDENIRFINGMLEPYGSVHYLPGSNIKPQHIRDAEVLIIRTRTICNSTFLKGSGVRVIATATIGTDHIDTVWCKNNNIKVLSAPGCNSGSVMQYIGSVLSTFALNHDFDFARKTIGIVGIGNIGSKVENMARVLGMKVLLNDPPRQRNELTNEFVSLEQIAEESDVITFHVPLTHNGRDRTTGLAGDDFFSRVKKGVIIINTSRGGVVSEKSLIESFRDGRVSAPVIDVWEGEPQINIELIEICRIATPHIAGYSLDGKWNASNMIIEQLCGLYNFKIKLPPLKQSSNKVWGTIFVDESDQPDMQIIKAILHTYDVEKDSNKFMENPGMFENLRNNYPYRREFEGYTITGKPGETDLFSRLGFKTS